MSAMVRSVPMAPGSDISDPIRAPCPSPHPDRARTPRAARGFLEQRAKLAISGECEPGISIHTSPRRAP
jgi:hypothetical protein